MRRTLSFLLIKLRFSCLSRCCLSSLGPLILLLPQTFTIYLAFLAVGFERVWWRLFQKRIVCQFDKKKIICDLWHTVASFIFVRVYFLGLAETEMFIDIWINGFDTCIWVLWLFCDFHCALNFANWLNLQKPRKLLFND